MKENPNIKMIISGGGTGGHLFPALAIAQQMKELNPTSEIIFVGALGKIEMEKVPKYGFEIHGLPIAGFQRSQIWKNINLPFKLLSSLLKARRIIKNFKPDVAVGVGGYASGPLLFMASKMGIPSLLQEQNSYAGVTNKILAKYAKTVCVAFPEMQRFFPNNKLVFTGNPVRKNIYKSDKNQALKKLGLKENCPTILVLGGSLGARTINQAISAHFNEILASEVQLIWQTGKYYYNDLLNKHSGLLTQKTLVKDFIDDMSTAYNAADLVISRAGALSISEITHLNKAAILVPSPNVAEDHQTKNAQALVQVDAAVLVTDSQAVEQLVPQALALINNKEELTKLAANTELLAKRDAALAIVNEIIKIIN